MRFADWYWLAWLFGGFCVYEFYSLFSGHPENTLSDTVWRWCKVTPGSTIASWSFLHIIVALFMVWLFFHIIFGWWSKI
jgi:hypothetical protein